MERGHLVPVGAGTKVNKGWREKVTFEPSPTDLHFRLSFPPAAGSVLALCEAISRTHEASA
ncbi:MAG: hypothetical protein ACI9OD_003960 [Limisphaerales bacterium]|jgi:hypothetical protein